MCKSKHGTGAQSRRAESNKLIEETLDSRQRTADSRQQSTDKGGGGG
jgi:hypothetical protein